MAVSRLRPTHRKATGRGCRVDRSRGGFAAVVRRRLAAGRNTMIVKLADLSHRERYAWMIASIIPRPIAWISTLSSDGVRNLAPFSFFNGICSDPPTVSIAIGRKRGGVRKDTLTNIEETGELVINIVPERLTEAMVASSGEYPSDVDEFEVAGVTAADSTDVRVPRVAEAELSFEAMLDRIIEVGEQPTALVLATLLTIHCSDAILDDDHLPDASKLSPVSRLGGQDYATLGTFVRIARPTIKDGR